MTQEHSVRESCVIDFERTKYAKDRAPLVTEPQQMHAVRCLERGRLGAAAMIGRGSAELVRMAKENAAFGPEVGTDFFDHLTASQQPEAVATDECVRWVEQLERRLQHDVDEFDYVLHATRRTLRLDVEDEAILRRQTQLFQCSVHFRPTRSAGVVRVLRTSVDRLLRLEDLLSFDEWQAEPLPRVRVAPGTYEIMLSPAAFEVLLDMLLLYVHAHVCGTPGLPISANDLGRMILNPGLTIDHRAGRQGMVDDEGVPLSELPLVKDGVFLRCYNDRYAAKRRGEPLTGQGFRSWQAADRPSHALPRPNCPYVRVQAGAESRASLMGGMKSGLFIDSLSTSYNLDFLIAPVRIPIFRAYSVENGHVRGEVEGQPILLTNLLDLFRSPLVLSKETQHLYGKELPYVYVQTGSILEPS